MCVLRQHVKNSSNAVKNDQQWLEGLRVLVYLPGVTAA